MKNRKSFDRAEKHRGTYFIAGLAIALGLVIAAFEWESEYIVTTPGFNIDLKEVEEIAEITIVESTERKVAVSENERPITVIEDNKPLASDNETRKEDPVYTPPDVVFVDSAGPEILDFSEKMPSFPGGIENLYRYLARNIRYPKDDLAIGIRGTVVVTFMVDEDGNIRNPHIKRSVSRNLDEEALRVVRSMPGWEPGEHRHRKVKVWVNLPIKFDIAK